MKLLLQPSSKLFLLCVGTLISFLLPGCDKAKVVTTCPDSLGCINIAAGKPIEIGVLQVLSGELKNSGLMQVRGVEMSLAKRNHQLLGHPVTLQVEDSGCSAEMGTNAALILTTKPKIVGIIGTYCSGAAAAAIPIISKAGLVMISGTNSAPSLTSINGKPGENWHPGYFRTMYNGIKMAEMASTFAFQELGVKKAATMNDGDNFTLELTKEFERHFVEAGGSIVRSIAINKGDQDMVPALEAIAYSKPELIYFPLFEPEATNVIKQVRGIPGLKKIKLIGSGGARSEKFLENIGASGIGLYLTATKSINNAPYKKLLSDYEIQYKGKPYHFSLPYVYDATDILLAAIESVADRQSDGSLQIGRKSLREALYNTSNFEGITGHLSSDKFGDMFGGAYAIIQLDNPTSGLVRFNANIKYLYQ